MRTREENLVLIVQMSILVILLMSSLLYEMIPISSGFVLQFLSGMLVLIIIWTTISWITIKEDLFSPYILFFFSAMLVSAGPVLLEIFKLNPYGIMDGIFDDKTIISTIYFTLLCLCSFHLGGVLTIRFRKQNSKYTLNNKSKASISDIKIVGWILFFVSIIPSAYIIYLQIRTVAVYGYIGIYQIDQKKGIFTFPYAMAPFIISSFMFLLAASKNDHKLRLFISCIVTIYSSLQLFIGSRSDAIMPIIAFLWLWHRGISKFSKRFLIIALLLLAFIISPSIKAIRNFSQDKLSVLSVYISEIGDERSPIKDTIAEYGGSMKIIAYTIEMVPRDRPHDYGMNYLYSLLLIVPNFIKGFSLEPKYGNPAVWITERVSPEVARIGGGLGFNIFAESYLAFGWFGGPLFILILGVIICSLTIWANQLNDELKLATISIFLAFLLHSARGTLAETVRPLFWYSIIPYILANQISWARKQPQQTEKIKYG